MAEKMERGRLGELVRSRRTGRGLTQAELARRIGVSRSAISELEAGRIGTPSIHLLSGLASALEIETAQLLSRVPRRRRSAAGIGEPSLGPYATGDSGEPDSKSLKKELELERRIEAQVVAALRRHTGERAMRDDDVEAIRRMIHRSWGR